MICPSIQYGTHVNEKGQAIATEFCEPLRLILIQ